MKAVVYQEPYNVSVEDVDDPTLEAATDVIVRITTSAICGSDLHMYEGRTDAEAGIVFGHENMGVVEEVGSAVTTLSRGDRDRKSTRLNSSHLASSYAVFCLKKKKRGTCFRV